MRLLIALAIMALLANHTLSRPLIVAHRGASAEAPENTLAAFRLAWEQGADAIEGDFHLTKDKQIVCIHDSHTGRVSSKKLPIRKHSLAELATLDIGSWKSPDFESEQIPTLAAVLATVPTSKKIFIEIKSSPDSVAPLLETLDASLLKTEQFVVITFDGDIIKQLKTRRPELTVNLLSNIRRRTKGGILLPTAEQLLSQIQETGADGIGIYAHPQLSEAFVTTIKDAGYPLHVWTVDDPTAAKKWATWGVRSITTNTPSLLISHLK